MMNIVLLICQQRLCSWPRQFWSFDKLALIPRNPAVT